MADEY